MTKNFVQNNFWSITVYLTTKPQHYHWRIKLSLLVSSGQHFAGILTLPGINQVIIFAAHMRRQFFFMFSYFSWECYSRSRNGSWTHLTEYFCSMTFLHTGKNICWTGLHYVIISKISMESNSCILYFYWVIRLDVSPRAICQLILIVIQNWCARLPFILRKKEFSFIYHFTFLVNMTSVITSMCFFGGPSSNSKCKVNYKPRR